MLWLDGGLLTGQNGNGRIFRDIIALMTCHDLLLVDFDKIRDESEERWD